MNPLILHNCEFLLLFSKNNIDFFKSLNPTLGKLIQ